MATAMASSKLFEATTWRPDSISTLVRWQRESTISDLIPAVTPVRLPSRIQTALLFNVLKKDECECAGPHKGEATDHGNESPEYRAEIVE